MKQLGVPLFLALGLVLVACGTGGSNSKNLNGNWTVSLVNPNGNAAFMFTTSLSQNGNSTLSGSNLQFTTATPCFGSDTTETGAVTLSGTTNGVMNGGFQLLISSAPTSSLSRNVLTLNGTVTNGNTISGTWNLVGINSGCSGSGNFTMTRM